MKKIFLYVTILASSCFNACRSQVPKPVTATGANIPANIDTFISNRVGNVATLSRAEGIIVGVLYNGGRRYYTAGFADSSAQFPFDPETIFEAGSITKTMTAYILTSVLKERNIPETASIITFLPDSVRPNKALERITFLQLMNHSAGFPRLPDNFDLVMGDLQPYDLYTTKELFAYLKTAQPKITDQSEYSNLGVGLAGVLAEIITGKPYGQLFKEYVTVPFNMPSTDTAAVAGKRMAVGMFEKVKAEYWVLKALQAAGTAKTTADDMLTYLEKSITPVNASSKAIIDKITDSTISINARLKVARGWHILHEAGKAPIYWHNGGTYGFSTFTAFDKEKKCAVIVVINAFNKNSFGDAMGFQIMKKMME